MFRGVDVLCYSGLKPILINNIAAIFLSTENRRRGFIAYDVLINDQFSVRSFLGGGGDCANPRLAIRPRDSPPRVGSSNRALVVMQTSPVLIENVLSDEESGGRLYL